MRDLIKKVLKEFIQPILVYEIKIGNKLLNERDEFIRVLDKNGIETVLFKNTHSQENIGTFSKFARVDPKYIDISIKTIQDDFVKLAKRVKSGCSNNKGCKIIVIDKPNGFDYQCWLVSKKNGNLGVVINTSIYHPSRLLNRDNSPTIVVEMNGDLILRNFP
jgi:hypothetical protein